MQIKPRVSCIIAETEYFNGKIDIRIMPLQIILKDFGTIENFINEESETSWGMNTTYKTKNSNEYDDKYINQIIIPA